VARGRAARAGGNRGARPRAVRWQPRVRWALPGRLRAACKHDAQRDRCRLCRGECVDAAHGPQGRGASARRAAAHSQVLRRRALHWGAHGPFVARPGVVGAASHVLASATGLRVWHGGRGARGFAGLGRLASPRGAAAGGGGGSDRTGAPLRSAELPRCDGHRCRLVAVGALVARTHGVLGAAARVGDGTSVTGGGGPARRSKQPRWVRRVPSDRPWLALPFRGALRGAPDRRDTAVHSAVRPRRHRERGGHLCGEDAHDPRLLLWRGRLLAGQHRRLHSPLRRDCRHQVAGTGRVGRSGERAGARALHGAFLSPLRVCQRGDHPTISMGQHQAVPVLVPRSGHTGCLDPDGERSQAVASRRRRASGQPGGDGHARDLGRGARTELPVGGSAGLGAIGVGVSRGPDSGDCRGGGDEPQRGVLDRGSAQRPCDRPCRSHIRPGLGRMAGERGAAPRGPLPGGAGHVCRVSAGGHLRPGIPAEGVQSVVCGVRARGRQLDRGKRGLVSSSEPQRARADRPLHAGRAHARAAISGSSFSVSRSASRSCR
jgi:hypothetical protein